MPTGGTDIAAGAAMMGGTAATGAGAAGALGAAGAVGGGAAAGGGALLGAGAAGAAGAVGGGAAAGGMGGADLLSGAGLGMGVTGADALGGGAAGMGAGGLDLAGIAPSLYGPGASGGSSWLTQMMPSWISSAAQSGSPPDPSQVVAQDIQGVGGSDPYSTEMKALAQPGGVAQTAMRGGALSKGINSTQLMLGALAGLGSFLSRPKTPATPGPSSTAATAGPYFSAPLNPTGFINRTPLNPMPAGGWQNYGAGPAQNFFQGNQLHFRHGGALNRAYADGGSTDDDYTVDTTGMSARDASDFMRSSGISPDDQRRGHFAMQMPGALQSLRNAVHGHGERNQPRELWTTRGHAQGGPAVFATDGGENYVRGPGDGTSDSVDAKLSDGEYVLTARDVAALGNGSNDAGAKRLDEMRARLHQDWGSRKPIGPSIHKSPLQYLKAA